MSIVFRCYNGSLSLRLTNTLKVFQKADALQNANFNNFKLLAEILPDNSGLTEASPFNPSTILDRRMTVVGIDNWRLEHSKSMEHYLFRDPI
jgi:hypothetical protein